MESVASKHRHVKCISLALDSVQVDAGTQARAGLDEGAVAEYAEAIGRGVEFPPVVVFRDGSAHFLADGFHRLAAFRQAGRESIEAEVRDGTREDARWYAIGANAAHGLRRSNADKAKAVHMALWARPGLSDRAIAEHVGVSPSTVEKYRSGLENEGLVSNLDSRTGKDGRQRPAHPVDVDPASVPLGDDESPEPEPEAEPEGVDEADGGGGDDEAEVDALPVDPYGEVLEPAVAEAFARKGELTGLMHNLSQVKSHVLKACDERDGDPDPLYAPLMPAQFKADLANAYQALKACIPHAACPHCRQIGCDVCQGLGYVNKEVYARFMAAQKHDLMA